MLDSKRFNKGDILACVSGEGIEIIDCIGSGGSADVYKVKYKETEMVLKWYKPHTVCNLKHLYINIKSLVESGSPSGNFLWPVDITPFEQDSFGFITNYKTEGFYELADFLIGLVSFSSFKILCDAALGIISAFKSLHSKGYAFLDVNDSSFFINFENGKILISNIDDIVRVGESTNFIGTPRYIAPEVFIDKSSPNNYSDRYTLAIILFMLICGSHPLEGKRSLGNIMTPEAQKKVYGKDALFIFDKNDDSNAPLSQIHSTAIAMWSCLPSYIKELFYKTFSKDGGILSPAKRPSETQWFEAFARWRSDIIPCSCGNEVFTINGEKGECEKCGSIVAAPYKIKMRDYAVPALKGTRLYRGRFGSCDALKPFALVVSSRENPDILGLANLSQLEWTVTTPDGKNVIVKDKSVVPLMDGITIEFNLNSTIKIVQNK